MKTLRHIIYTALSAMAVSMLACGCTRGGSDTSRPTLCVSIEPQRKILTELAGDDYEVVTLLKAGADPETYEPSVAQRMALSRADAYFTVGTLPFERQLAGSESAVTVYDTSRGIATLTGTHHDHDDGSDPHVWTSLRNGRQIAANMTEALCELNPGNAPAYRERYTRMAARIDSLDAATAARLSGSGVRAFAIWHPSLSYYARDYGLRRIAAHAETKEMSPGEITAMIGAARADSVRVFFTDKDMATRQAAVVSDEIGSRIVGINTLGYDWEQQISQITDALTRR